MRGPNMAERDSGEHSCDIAEVVGPYAWAVIHHAVESFPCAPCAEEGASLMRFAHDLVNIKLRKGIRYPRDIRRWLGLTQEAEDQLQPVQNALEKVLTAPERSLAHVLAQAFPIAQAVPGPVHMAIVPKAEIGPKDILGRDEDIIWNIKVEGMQLALLQQDIDGVEISEDEHPEDDLLEREIEELVRSTLAEMACA